jgi:DNA invertase Pin-like site-specific DNA recombinase
VRAGRGDGALAGAGAPSFRSLVTILGGPGQTESEIIVERTKAGLAANRARGPLGGRPPALNPVQVKAARATLASGTVTAAEGAGQLGCAPSTLYCHLPGG